MHACVHPQYIILSTVHTLSISYLMLFQQTTFHFLTALFTTDQCMILLIMFLHVITWDRLLAFWTARDVSRTMDLVRHKVCCGYLSLTVTRDTYNKVTKQCNVVILQFTHSYEYWLFLTNIKHMMFYMLWKLTVQFKQYAIVLLINYSWPHHL